MKTKLISLSILWASLLIAEAILYHRTPHYDTMFMLLLICSATSLLILAGRDCPESHNKAPGHDG